MLIPLKGNLVVTVPAVTRMRRLYYAGGPHMWQARVIPNPAQRSRPGPGRSQENTPSRDLARYVFTISHVISYICDIICDIDYIIGGRQTAISQSCYDITLWYHRTVTAGDTVSRAGVHGAGILAVSRAGVHGAGILVGPDMFDIEPYTSNIELEAATSISESLFNIRYRSSTPWHRRSELDHRYQFYQRFYKTFDLV